MSLITSVISYCQSGRPKLIQIFLFCFEEDVISLYNEFKLEWRSGSEKKEKSYLVKKNQNLKNTVRGILLLCDNMPDKKPEEPTEMLVWKNSLELMSNEAINILISASMEKCLINNEKDLTMTFVRDKIVRKNMFGDTFLLPDGYGKEEFINNLI